MSKRRARIRERVLARDQNACQYCGSTSGFLTMGHIIPASQGGAHEDWNLRALCRTCNTGEAAKHGGWVTA